MSVERLSLDSNILFYTVDADAGERKGKLTAAQASAHVEDWQTVFPLVAATPGSLRLAVRAVEHHNLSFWDAMQWAAAKQGRGHAAAE